MRKILIILLLLAATTSRVYADNGLWREAGQSCVFGGSVLGITSILVLYPAMAMGTNTIPVTSLILGNTLFGCGIAAIGASAAYGFGWAYDRVFGPESSEGRSPPAASTHPVPPSSAIPPSSPPSLVVPPRSVVPPASIPGPIHSPLGGIEL